MRAFPSGVLAAAVLAAEGVSSLLVGSAALWLRGEVIDVGDADVVIEPGEAIWAVFVTRLPGSQPGRCHRRVGWPADR
jgi:hypothetical protein